MTPEEQTKVTCLIYHAATDCADDPEHALLQAQRIFPELHSVIEQLYSNEREEHVSNSWDEYRDMNAKYPTDHNLLSLIQDMQNGETL